MIGFNSTFGWVSRNNIGILSPADPDSIIQQLYLYQGGTIPFLDRIDPRLDSSVATDVNCIRFHGDDSVSVPSGVIQTVWSVAYNLADAVETGQSAEYFGGGATDRNFGFRYSSKSNVFFREAGGTAHYWDGTGNTTAVDAHGTDGEYILSSDGTGITLYVDGVDKGYITPTSTQGYFLKFGNGYSAGDTLRGCDCYSNDIRLYYSAVTPATIDSATPAMALPMSEGGFADDQCYNTATIDRSDAGTLIAGAGTIADMRSTSDKLPSLNLSNGWGGFARFDRTSTQYAAPATPVYPSEDTVLEARVRWRNTSTLQACGNNVPSNGRYEFLASGGKWRLDFGDSVLTTDVDIDTEWHNLVMSKDGHSIDGVSITNTYTTFGSNTTGKHHIGITDAGTLQYPADIDVQFYRLTTNGAVDFEYRGSSLINGTSWHDYSDSENDAVISGGAGVSMAPAMSFPELNYAENINIVGFGDSNTEGSNEWIEKVGASSRFISEVNEGVGGNDASDMLARYTSAVTDNYDSRKINYLVLWTGVNDWATDSALVVADLDTITTQAQAEGYTVIWMNYYGWNEQRREYLEGLNDAYLAHCTSNGLQLVDLATALNGEDGIVKDEYQATPTTDPHLNQAGEQVVADTFLALFDSVYYGSSASEILDAEGNDLTNPAGYDHNGAECSLVQTDTWFATNTPNVYHDGSFVAMSYQDLLDQPSFDQGVLYQWEKVNGVCCLKEMVQRDPVDYYDTVTPAIYQKDKNWAEKYTDECGTTLEAVTHEGAIVTHLGNVVLHEV